MNRKAVKKILVLIIFLLINSLNFVLAQDSKNHSINQSNNICKTLIKHKINFYIQEITEAQGDNFAPNIIIDIYPTFSKEYTNPLNQVIYCFTQDFFDSNPDFSLDFIKYVKEQKLPFLVTIVYVSDNDKYPVSPKLKSVYSTDVYTESIDNDDLVAAFVVLNKDYYQNQLYILGNDTTSPKWLAKTVKSSFRKNEKNIKVPPYFQIIQTFKVGKSNVYVDSFLNKKFPCVGFPLGTQEIDSQILQSTLSFVQKNAKEEWSSHYSYFNLFSFDFWIDELFYVLSFILIIFITLLILCFYPIINYKKSKHIYIEIIKNWYFIVITLFATALIFFISQKIFSFTNKIPALQFILKYVVTVPITFYLLALQTSYNFKISKDAVTYQMVTIGLINIILMGMLNISLVFVFIIEFIIILISTRFNERIPSIIFLFALALPLMMVLQEIHLNADSVKLSKFVNGNFLKSLWLASVLYPIQMQWNRILFTYKLNEIEEKKLQLKKVHKITIYTLVYLGISVFLYFIPYTIRNTINKKQILSYPQIINSEENQIHVKHFNKTYNKLNTRTLYLWNDKKVTHWDIQILNDQSSPILDCNYNYKVINSSTYSILIPDYPDSTLEIIYTSDTSPDTTFNFTCYIEKEDGTIEKQTSKLFIPGKK